MPDRPEEDFPDRDHTVANRDRVKDRYVAGRGAKHERRPTAIRASDHQALVVNNHLPTTGFDKDRTARIDVY